MTYKEAINFAKSRLEGLLPYTTEEVSEVRFYKSAIVAFEKQLPKKPTGNKMNCCPSCKGLVGINTDIIHAKYNYCSHCGQALDWGDAE